MKDINLWMYCVDMMNTLGFTFELNISRVILIKEVGDEIFEAKESFTNLDELHGYLKGYQAATYRYKRGG